MVQWVYEAAEACDAFDEVVVATDSAQIAACVEGFGGTAVMTRSDHLSGTDRVAEVAAGRPGADVVVNVQGDQPFATPDMLRRLVAPYLAGEQPQMTTLACPLAPEAVDDPNAVKVVCGAGGDALYFSRSPIPYGVGDTDLGLHHLGLYAFARDTLLRFPTLTPTPLERQERLEQLRALEHGISIRVCHTPHAVTEINTTEDLERARLQVARA